MPVLIYLFLIVLELVFVFSFCVYMFFLIYSHLKGSPYVPTKMKEIEFILAEMKPKRNSVFYDLGCGDGRMIRTAVKKYEVKGIGVDVNPLLIGWSRFFASVGGLPGAVFMRKNIFDVDLRDADDIYIFLLPGLISRLVPKFKKEMKPGCLLVSHGFKIDEFKRYLVKSIPHTPFPTYFYRLSKR